MRFAIWFFVTSGLVGLMTVSASNLHSDGWLVLIPAWIAASMIFWLWTPRFLLHREVTLRALVPGALLASFVLGATVATAPLGTGPTVNQNARAFGSFGVVIALLAYIFTVITISMACAVFSPVWAEWRQTERDRKAGHMTPETYVVRFLTRLGNTTTSTRTSSPRYVSSARWSRVARTKARASVAHVPTSAS